MAHLIQELTDKQLINPPSWLPNNSIYLAIMGSNAYGISTDSSDYDLYGIAIPPKADIFPHLGGWLHKFDEAPETFHQWIKHHVFDEHARAGKGREYDFNVTGIVSFFAFMLESNPNFIDTLFVNQESILHITKIGQMIRENRHMFLCRELWPRYKGYAYGQLHKASSKNPKEGSVRAKLRKENDGMDVKFLYNVVRLLSECEQLLLQGDLDLQEPGRREHMKAIRRGDVSEAEIRKWAADKEKHLEKAYSETSLPKKPRKEEMRELLIHCLEEHYGSLGDAVVQTGWAENSLKEIEAIIHKNRKRLHQ